MSYFKHFYASNSDLKKAVSKFYGAAEPDNLEAIYNFGTQFHSGITQPQLFDSTGLADVDVELIGEMSKTFWKDRMCRDIVMMPDFRREHEFYRQERFCDDGPGTGITARCKADGDSKSLGVILELKGVKVATEKSFREAVMHFGYDQGATWYLNTMSSEAYQYRYELIVGISKIHPDRMFKILVDWKNEYYRSGLQKVRSAKHVWKNIYGLK